MQNKNNTVPTQIIPYFFKYINKMVIYEKCKCNCCGYISSCNRYAHIWYTKTPWYCILLARWHLIDKIYPPTWNMFLFIWISFAIPFSDLSSSVSFFSLSISVSSSKFFFSDSCNLLQKNTNKKTYVNIENPWYKLLYFCPSFHAIWTTAQLKINAQKAAWCYQMQK